MTGAWDRIKQRKIVQWSIAYLAVAWAALQGLDFLATHFGSWDAVVRGATVFLIISYLAVVIIAWYHGEQGRQRVPPTEIALLAIVLVTAMSGAVIAARSTPEDAAAPSTIAHDDAAPPANSVAVLPFVNMGGDPKNEYFSDGVTEEILDALSKVPGFKVAARTSSFAFKGKSEDISDIGRKLRVAYVLEGSVQRSGDQVRVTAQLIKTSDGFHVWSENYTRPASDLFAVEDEISRAIAKQLQTTLAADVILASNATSSVNAHELYLLGLNKWSQRTNQSIHEAVDYFTRAIAADTQYSRAHAGLALALSVLPNYDRSVPMAQAFARGKAAAGRALALDPRSAEANAALSQMAEYEDQMATAESYARKAIALNPNYATAHQWLAEVLWATGRLPQALSEMNAALALDPLSPVMHSGRCAIKMAAGDNTGAINDCLKARTIDPEFMSYNGALVQLSLITRDYELANSSIHTLLAGSGRDWVADTLINGLRDPAAKPALIRMLQQQNPGPELTITAEYAGEREIALNSAQRAAAAGMPPFAFWPVLSAPSMKSLREDPRFPAVYHWPRKGDAKH